MVNRIRTIALLLAGTSLCSVLTGWSILDGARTAWAQDSSRSSRSDSGSGDDRRDRYRRFGGDRGDRGSDRGGDRGSDRRDWRGRSSDDSRRDERSSSSSQSANTNSKSPASGSSNTPPKPTSDAKPSSTADAALATKTWAASFVKEHDKNKNGWLDGDELKDYHGKPEAINKDGVITVESLTAAASSAATPSPAAATAPSTGGSTASDHSKGDPDISKRVFFGTAGGLASGSKDGDKRRSYRFTPADERLPSGLPSWFKEKDKNGDGQIEMSEFAHTWTSSTAAEFQRYDLDGDGVITAKEAASKPAPKGD